jgi:glutamyl/glutaminyl-tRNA synthetase
VNRLQKLRQPAIITRFAPTPSGFLHVGNVFSFLITWLIARKSGGRILLRIDDLDRERLRIAYVENIFRTLEWMGLDWDFGPFSVEQFEKKFSQTLRMELYNTSLEKLKDKKAVFACGCSRKALTEGARGYPGICLDKRLTLDEPDMAWRLNTSNKRQLLMHATLGGDEALSLPESQSHFIVRRRDGIPAYHLASVVDDDFFSVNTVVRGQDLLESSIAQLYLAKVLDYSGFSNASFVHHALVLDGGKKLSKSQKSPAVLDEFQSDRQKLYIKLGGWLGLSAEQSASLDDISRHFSPRSVNYFSRSIQ